MWLVPFGPPLSLANQSDSQTTNDRFPQCFSFGILTLHTTCAPLRSKNIFDTARSEWGFTSHLLTFFSPPHILSDTSQRAVLALAGHMTECVMLHSSAWRTVCLSGLVIYLFFNIKIEKYAHAHYNNCSIIYACIWHPHSFFHRFTYYRLLMDSK